MHLNAAKIRFFNTLQLQAQGLYHQLRGPWGPKVRFQALSIGWGAYVKVDEVQQLG